MGWLLFKRLVCGLTLVAFVGTSAGPACAQGVASLPAPMLGLSLPQSPSVLMGMKAYPNDPLQFDFIVKDQTIPASEMKRLVNYFLASLAVPGEDLWVNLSPYERNRIVPQDLGKTGMGRDLLRQDYLLKQLTAALIYPEGETGKKFWARIYEEAYQKYGTTDIPVDTLNKVWIVPGTVEVYERGSAAYVAEATLKVMLESDYRALENRDHLEASNAAGTGVDTQALSRKILREIVIPVLEKEVNEGGNFAVLRQVYHSLILATWYKKKLKDSLLSRLYVNSKKVAGLEWSGKDAQGQEEADAGPEQIWAQYVEAFRKGAYNYVKEERDALSGENIPRKYFSGGMNINPDAAMKIEAVAKNFPRSAAIVKVGLSALPLAGLKQRASLVSGGLSAALGRATFGLSRWYRRWQGIDEVKQFKSRINDYEQLYREAMRKAHAGRFYHKPRQEQFRVLSVLQKRLQGHYDGLVGELNYYRGRTALKDGVILEAMSRFEKEAAGKHQEIQDLLTVYRDVIWPNDHGDHARSAYIKNQKKAQSIFQAWENGTDVQKKVAAWYQEKQDLKRRETGLPYNEESELKRIRLDARMRKVLMDEMIYKVNTHASMQEAFPSFVVFLKTEAVMREIEKGLSGAANEGEGGASLTPESVAKALEISGWSTTDQKEEARRKIRQGFKFFLGISDEEIQSLGQRSEFWRDIWSRGSSFDLLLGGIYYNVLGVEQRQALEKIVEGQLVGDIEKINAGNRVRRWVFSLGAGVLMAIAAGSAFFGGDVPDRDSPIATEPVLAQKADADVAVAQALANPSRVTKSDVAPSKDPEVLLADLMGSWAEDDPIAVDDERFMAQELARVKALQQDLAVQIREKTEQARIAQKEVQAVRAEEAKVTAGIEDIGKDKETVKPVGAPIVSGSWQGSANSFHVNAQVFEEAFKSSFGDSEVSQGMGDGMLKAAGIWQATATIHGEYLSKGAYTLLDPVTGKLFQRPSKIIPWQLTGERSQDVVEMSPGAAVDFIALVPPEYKITFVESKSEGPAPEVAAGFDVENRGWHLHLNRAAGMVRIHVMRASPKELPPAPLMQLVDSHGRPLDNQVADDLLQKELPGPLWAFVKWARQFSMEDRAKLLDRFEQEKWLFYTWNPGLRRVFDREHSFLRSLFEKYAASCSGFTRFGIILRCALGLNDETAQSGFLIGADGNVTAYDGHEFIYSERIGIYDPTSNADGLSSLSGREGVRVEEWKAEDQALELRASQVERRMELTMAKIMADWEKEQLEAQMKDTLARAQGVIKDGVGSAAWMQNRYVSMVVAQEEKMASLGGVLTAEKVALLKTQMLAFDLEGRCKKPEQFMLRVRLFAGLTDLMIRAGVADIDWRAKMWEQLRTFAHSKGWDMDTLMEPFPSVTEDLVPGEDKKGAWFWDRLTGERITVPPGAKLQDHIAGLYAFVDGRGKFILQGRRQDQALNKVIIPEAVTAFQFIVRPFEGDDWLGFVQAQNGTKYFVGPVAEKNGFDRVPVAQSISEEGVFMHHGETLFRVISEGGARYYGSLAQQWGIEGLVGGAIGMPVVLDDGSLVFVFNQSRGNCQFFGNGVPANIKGVRYESILTYDVRSYSARRWAAPVTLLSADRKNTISRFVGRIDDAAIEATQDSPQEIESFRYGQLPEETLSGKLVVRRPGGSFSIGAGTGEVGLKRASPLANMSRRSSVPGGTLGQNVALRNASIGVDQWPRFLPDRWDEQLLSLTRSFERREGDAFFQQGWPALVGGMMTGIDDAHYFSRSQFNEFFAKYHAQVTGYYQQILAVALTNGPDHFIAQFKTFHDWGRQWGFDAEVASVVRDLLAARTDAGPVLGKALTEGEWIALFRRAETGIQALSGVDPLLADAYLPEYRFLADGKAAQLNELLQQSIPWTLARARAFKIFKDDIQPFGRLLALLGVNAHPAAVTAVDLDAYFQVVHGPRGAADLFDVELSPQMRQGPLPALWRWIRKTPDHLKNDPRAIVSVSKAAVYRLHLEQWRVMNNRLSAILGPSFAGKKSAALVMLIGDEVAHNILAQAAFFGLLAFLLSYWSDNLRTHDHVLGLSAHRLIRRILLESHLPAIGFGDEEGLTHFLNRIIVPGKIMSSDDVRQLKARRKSLPVEQRAFLDALLLVMDDVPGDAHSFKQKLMYFVPLVNMMLIADPEKFVERQHFNKRLLKLLRTLISDLHALSAVDGRSGNVPPVVSVVKQRLTTALILKNFYQQLWALVDVNFILQFTRKEYDDSGIKPETLLAAFQEKGLPVPGRLTGGATALLRINAALKRPQFHQALLAKIIGGTLVSGGINRLAAQEQMQKFSRQRLFSPQEIYSILFANFIIPEQMTALTHDRSPEGFLSIIDEEKKNPSRVKVAGVILSNQDNGHPGKRSGSGDFDRIRPAAPDEPVPARNISWPATAAAGHTMVIEKFEEKLVTAGVLVDLRYVSTDDLRILAQSLVATAKTSVYYQLRTMVVLLQDVVYVVDLIKPQARAFVFSNDKIASLEQDHADSTLRKLKTMPRPFKAGKNETPLRALDKMVQMLMVLYEPAAEVSRADWVAEAYENNPQAQHHYEQRVGIVREDTVSFMNKDILTDVARLIRLNEMGKVLNIFIAGNEKRALELGASFPFVNRYYWRNVAKNAEAVEGNGGSHSRAAMEAVLIRNKVGPADSAAASTVERENVLKGGIDLTSGKITAAMQAPAEPSQAAAWNIDAATLQQLQLAPGLTPAIMSIHLTDHLTAFFD